MAEVFQGCKVIWFQGSRFIWFFGFKFLWYCICSIVLRVQSSLRVYGSKAQGFIIRFYGFMGMVLWSSDSKVILL